VIQLALWLERVRMMNPSNFELGYIP
jgi:hypothetical protein